MQKFRQGYLDFVTQSKHQSPGLLSTLHLLLPFLVNADIVNPHVPPEDELSNDEVKIEFINVMNPASPQQLCPSGRPDCRCGQPTALTYNHEDPKKKVSRGKKNVPKRTCVAKHSQTTSPISVHDSVKSALQDTEGEDEAEEADDDEDDDSIFKPNGSPSDDDESLGEMSAEVLQDIPVKY
jgi:hypothetical protein